MRARSLRRAAAVTASVAASLVVFVGSAAATPGSWVTSTEISRTSMAGKDVVIREITIEPGGTTGWHTHLGPLLGVVKAGTLTHYNSHCHVGGVYHEGDTVYEPSGEDNVHIGRNEGDSPMVLDVIYVLPAGAPLSVDQDAPHCD